MDRTFHHPKKGDSCFLIKKNTLPINPRVWPLFFRFSAASVDARDVVKMHNITVSISPAPALSIDEKSEDIQHEVGIVHFKILRRDSFPANRQGVSCMYRGWQSSWYDNNFRNASPFLKISEKCRKGKANSLFLHPKSRFHCALRWSWGRQARSRGNVSDTWGSLSNVRLVVTKQVIQNSIFLWNIQKLTFRWRHPLRHPELYQRVF